MLSLAQEILSEAIQPNCADPTDRSREAARRAMLIDLARSGITNEDLINKRFTPRSADEIKRITGHHRVLGYSIRYFDLKQEEVPDYTRIRFLEPVYRDGKIQRYWQPSRSFSRAYLDPAINWMEIARDPSRTITVTEGEKKAIALCQAGIPTIAIAGVWNWGAKRRGWAVLPEFLHLADAGGRLWKIVFDHDQHKKPSVAAALDNFMRGLLDIGGRPSYVRLPGPENGVDDYLKAYGVEKYRELQEKSEDYALVKPLWDLNKKIAITEVPPSIINQESGLFYKREEARLVSTRETVTFEMPGGKKRTQPAITYWLDTWPMAKRYRGVTYRPNRPRDLPDGYFNMWLDDGCRAARGDIRLFFKLLRNCFPDSKIRRWALHWLAHLLQHSDIKLQSALVLHGKPACGKTTFAFILLGLIFGPSNISKIGSRELYGNFNGWARAKRIIVAEEISGEDPRHDYDALKDQISGATISINEKFQPAIELPNLGHMIFLSNKRVPVFADGDDRRYAISHCGANLSQTEIQEIRRWIDNGGAEKVRFFLEHFRLEGRFNPHDPPPFSDAKREVIQRSRSGLERWAHDLAGDVKSDEKAPRFATFARLMLSARELEPHASQKAVRNALEAAGFREIGRFSLGREGRHHIWALRENDDCGGEGLREAYEADQPRHLGYWDGAKKY